MNLVPVRKSNADYGELVEQLMPMAAAFYTLFEYDYREAHHRAMIDTFAGDAAIGSLWLVEQASVCVGYVALSNVFTFEFGGRVGLIDELFILPSFRGHGLGGDVVRELQHRMPSLGLCALHLQTEHANPRAQSLYESLGFKTLPRATLAFVPVV